MHCTDGVFCPETLKHYWGSNNPNGRVKKSGVTQMECHFFSQDIGIKGIKVITPWLNPVSKKKKEKKTSHT